MQNLVRGAISGALGLTESVLTTSLDVVRLLSDLAASPPDAAPQPTHATADEDAATNVPGEDTPSSVPSSGWRTPETGDPEGDLDLTAKVLRQRTHTRPPRSSIKRAARASEPIAAAEPADE